MVNIVEYYRQNTGTALENSEYLQFNMIPTELNLESQFIRRSFRRIRRSFGAFQRVFESMDACIANWVAF